MPKEFSYRGRSLEELKEMSLNELASLLDARARRSLKRGLTEEEKKLLENIRKHPDKFHKTHCRDMIILPEMVGAKIGVYVGGTKAEGGGEKWKTVVIKPEMIGFRLGDFAIPVKRVSHSAPGIGASKGSKHFATK